MVAHKDLTGADLHEPKGIASAEQGMVYVSNGLGSGVWRSLANQVLAVVGQSIGVGQTWKDVTGSRSGSVVYRNTTGRPIQITFVVDTSASRWFQVSTDGTNWVNHTRLHDGSGYRPVVSAIIPQNHYYRINGAAIVLSWAELT